MSQYPQPPPTNFPERQKNSRAFFGRSRRLNEDVASSSTSARFWDKHSSRSSKQDYVVDEIIDVEKDMEILKTKHLKLLNPKKLYEVGTFSMNTGLFTHFRETTISCTDESILLNILHSKSEQELKKHEIQNDTSRPLCSMH